MGCEDGDSCSVSTVTLFFQRVCMVMPFCAQATRTARRCVVRGKQNSFACFAFFLPQFFSCPAKTFDYGRVADLLSCKYQRTAKDLSPLPVRWLPSASVHCSKGPASPSPRDQGRETTPFHKSAEQSCYNSEEVSMFFCVCCSEASACACA